MTQFTFLKDFDKRMKSVGRYDIIIGSYRGILEKLEVEFHGQMFRQIQVEKDSCQHLSYWCVC